GADGVVAGGWSSRPCLSRLQCYRPHRALRSFPTRRSSDLDDEAAAEDDADADADAEDDADADDDAAADDEADDAEVADGGEFTIDRKSTRLNSSHVSNSYAVFCLKKKRAACRGRTPRGSCQ